MIAGGHLFLSNTKIIPVRLVMHTRATNYWVRVVYGVVMKQLLLLTSSTKSVFIEG